jgi:hypothetical protein
MHITENTRRDPATVTLIEATSRSKCEHSRPATGCDWAAPAGPTPGQARPGPRLSVRRPLACRVTVSLSKTLLKGPEHNVSDH